MKTESLIDFLEGELDPSLRDDYAKLLTHSKEDEKVLADLKRLRASIKHLDPCKNVQADQFNQTLYDNIMSEINGVRVQPKWQLSLLSTKTWGAAAASILLVIGFLGLYKTTLQEKTLQTADLSTDKIDWIVQESAKNPEVLAETVNSYKTDEDMAFDALAFKSEGMSDDELSDVMDDILK